MIEYHSSTRFTVRYKHYSVKCLHRHKGSSPFGFSSGGGTPTFGVLATKNRGSKTPLSKKAHQKAHPTPIKHPVPTQLAEIWEQLDRAERRKLEQVISEMQDRK
jgi:hypothetical protein